MEQQFLSREAFASEQARDLPWESVDIPQLGGVACVQGMSGTERDEFEASLVEGRGKRRDVNTENIRAKLAVRCLFDRPSNQGGKRLFLDHEADLLGAIRADILSRIFEAAQRLSGVTDEDIDELGKSSKSLAASGGSRTN